jgi:FliI/YscN family ATPase
MLRRDGASIALAPYLARVREADPAPCFGHVTRVVGLVVESEGPRAKVGEVCELRRAARADALPIEVVGFRDGRLLSVPLGDTAGIRPGDRIVARGGAVSIPAGDALLGRVIDGLGRPLDGLGPIDAPYRAPLKPPAMNPLDRDPVVAPIGTGVRAIDALLTCGRGQRVGLFGGSGVGKSTLLGMMARGTAADVVVLALVGERGREVRSFLENDLGRAGLARSVVVVSTSDSPPLVRLRAAYGATALAEYFRDRGRHVLLMMDSVTRFAMAQREVGLAAGEPPTTRGYTPSVFAALPRLVERLGPSPAGSITGFYTVLTEGDDVADPVAEAARSLLDGHVQLDRELAERGHFPAIDVLRSVSRVALDVMSPAHVAAARALREHIAVLHESRDLLAVGAYRPGANPRLDAALALRDAIAAFLRQGIDEPAPFDGTLRALTALVSQGVSHGTRSPAPAA